MIGASHRNHALFYQGLGILTALFLAVALAEVAGPAAAMPDTQAATSTVVAATHTPAILTITVTTIPAGTTTVATTPRRVLPTRAVITGTLGASDVLPAGVGTVLPKPVATGGAQGVPTGGAAPIAPQDGASRPGVGSTTASSDNSGLAALLPWLVGALVLAGLAGMAFFALRPKVAVAPVVVGTPPDTTTATQAVVPPVQPIATPLGTAAVRCPNCDTLNPPDRRFCDECGQDLRPAGAAPTGGAVIDEATTPYLETLSRGDEQLEFVLARNTVTLGRANDNDVVIDDSFIGWQTVSPHHARLTRQGDGFILTDLQSDNGTFVNSARTGQNLLEDGMTVALGKVEFVYRVPQA